MHINLQYCLLNFSHFNSYGPRKDLVLSLCKIIAFYFIALSFFLYSLYTKSVLIIKLKV